MKFVKSQNSGGSDKKVLKTNLSDGYIILLELVKTVPVSSINEEKEKRKEVTEIYSYEVQTSASEFTKTDTEESGLSAAKVSTDSASLLPIQRSSVLDLAYEIVEDWLKVQSVDVIYIRINVKIFDKERKVVEKLVFLCDDSRWICGEKLDKETKESKKVYTLQASMLLETGSKISSRKKNYIGYGYKKEEYRTNPFLKKFFVTQTQSFDLEDSQCKLYPVHYTKTSTENISKYVLGEMDLFFEKKEE